MKNRKVLIVDDEVNLLRSLKRNLRNLYEVDTAEGGVAGLHQILEGGPYAVIVSDLQMPDVDGLQVLELAKIVSPDTFRIMLTGNVKGNIPLYGADNKPWFSCVNKPCTTERLCSLFNEGIDRYGIAISLSSPQTASSINQGPGQESDVEACRRDALERSQKLRTWSRSLGSSLKLQETYQYELAGMLSQISLLIRSESAGSTSDPADEDFRKQQAASSAEIVRRIPRLTSIAEMIALQYVSDFPRGTSNSIQRGARILRMLTDYEVLVRTMSEAVAIRQMEGQSGAYGDELFRCFSELMTETFPDLETNSTDLGTAKASGHSVPSVAEGP